MDRGGGITSLRYKQYRSTAVTINRTGNAINGNVSFQCMNYKITTLVNHYLAVSLKNRTGNVIENNKWRFLFLYINYTITTKG